jgi:hypothetical protein
VIAVPVAFGVGLFHVKIQCRPVKRAASEWLLEAACRNALPQSATWEHADAQRQAKAERGQRT